MHPFPIAHIAEGDTLKNRFPVQEQRPRRDKFL